MPSNNKGYKFKYGCSPKETIAFIDGFGRTVQVKKDDVLTASGKVVTDALGGRQSVYTSGSGKTIRTVRHGGPDGDSAWH